MTNSATSVPFLKRQVSVSPLVAFRIIFGCLMLFGVLRFLMKGWVHELYIAPQFHFHYWGFEWINPLPGNWMYLPFALMIVAAVGIILGAWYRVATTLFFVCFTYVELIDLAYYLNHYYFVSLMALCLIFVPANADFSVDVIRNPAIYRHKIAAWPIFLIQFQLSCVYFFAGLAKIHPDWLLEAQPLRIWLQGYRDLPVVGTLMASAWVAYLFSWFGCLYDLSIPFMLRWQRTRLLGYSLVVVFHILTWLLFPIGVFPWVMIFSTLIFFSADFHDRWLDWLKNFLHWQRPTSAPRYTAHSRLILPLLIIYVSAQLLIPFRYLFYPGELFWHEQGFRFSWRVMLMHKEGHAVFYVCEAKTGKRIEINNSNYLTPVQEDQMRTQPDMILQYANYLKTRWQDTTIHVADQNIQLKDPLIRANIFVSLNGRKSRPFVTDRIDLSAQKTSLKHITWIEPFDVSMP